ncbi:GAF domain-containing protein [Nocardioides sp. WY-20]|uniref:GAF domain-containing protein n=1 Tax=Nocardioides jiangxiensis TaxID=3064524 RepID=A0ABT9AYP7_9ACTN|nr:GAF domain-containing sensor histidine kinase [Nocardioides sp. WY-20]MDO7867058.1 GAF domain-containing protein [Nocardioides sp. WY-20]
MEGTEEGLSTDARVLLEAVAAMSSDLDLDKVLRRIVESACELTGARYGALGVIGDHDDLAAFITHGVDDDERARIGDPPHGRGILGLLIRHPGPLRLPHLQEHAASYGFPANHPPMTSFLGVPVLIRGVAFGNLYLTEKAGRAEFTEQDQALVEALASAAGVVVQNARAYALSERQRVWLEATARLEQALRPGSTTKEALDLVAVAARVVSRSPLVAVLSDATGTPSIVSTEGREADSAPLVVAKAQDAVLEAFAGGRPDPVALDDELLAVAVPVRAELFGAAVLVVVLDPRQERGMLRADLDMLSSFGEQAGLALDRARALADRAELAIVSDRDRIARDLHDLVIQRLFATGLQLQGVRGQVVSPVVADRIDSTVADLDTTIRDIRSTIFALQRPGATSLRAQVAALALEYEGVLGFAPVVRTAGPVDTAVSADICEHLVAACREALSNAARHASARSIAVSVSTDSEEVVLTVTDDGIGITPGGRESGLRNLRQRADGLGGSLSVLPADPRGTRLLLRVPLSGSSVQQA